MDNFKLASQQKLRFHTTKGTLTTEQLWDLSLEDLDNLAVALEADLEKSQKKSFLVKSSEKNIIAKLKFDIVLDVLNTRIEDSNKALAERERKEHNSKILKYLEAKRDQKMKDLTEEELEKLLR